MKMKAVVWVFLLIGMIVATIGAVAVAVDAPPFDTPPVEAPPVETPPI